ncbi:hypothetical protein FKX85_03130 [Echinicola soli]|uniref:Uncharacterized protein n=1 Tax=Echinicola soli TaxID=2591634 RepID=A0A514CE30_9BACT|nr:hypothetical protein [Echinicola soli]QDH78081.1 hypothetical protein FKX85_03130 [Echinicola soli]
MKKDIKIWMSLVVFLLCSCDSGKKIYSSYRIVNNTGYQLEFLIFERTNGTFVRKIELAQNAGEWVSDKFQISEPGGRQIPVKMLLEGDSVRILFNKEKVLVYSEVYSDRNILFEENYAKVSIDDTHVVRRYNVTEEDYKNAVLIDNE